MVAIVQPVWHLFLFIHMKMRVASFQGRVHLLKHTLLRKKHPKRSIVQQLELDIIEAKTWDFSEDDLSSLCTPQNSAHPMVSSDNKVETVSKAKVLDSVPDVAHGTIHLSNHLLAFWGIWSIFVTSFIWFSKVQRDKVQVLLAEPLSNHFVDVQSPVCFIRMIIETWFHLPHADSLSFVGGCCTREMQGSCFETLEEYVGEEERLIKLFHLSVRIKTFSPRGKHIETLVENLKTCLCAVIQMGKLPLSQ